MAPTKSIPARKSAPPPRKTTPVVVDDVDLVDDVDGEAQRLPRLGERVLVAVHPDKHDGRDDVAIADVTRVVTDDDGVVSVNLRVHYDAAVPTGHLVGVAWHPDRETFDAAESAAYVKYLPGHQVKAGKVITAGENHLTQAPWRVEDVRHWLTGAWPIDAGE